MSGVTRRAFLGSAGLTAGIGAMGSKPAAAAIRTQADRERRPNFVVIMTDDQGYGDLACLGNPHVRTPNIDRLHGQSLRFTNFYVTPVCAPTRAGLITGRYNYRTGVVDTYMGRAMMDPSEITIAETLREGGYRTGIFGKWHLGDNYPLRAADKGFEESLVHLGGGIAQPSEPLMTGYFNPILRHNGNQRQYEGYCTDVFADAAIDFIEEHRDEPFFAYLSTNAPHTPLIIHDSLVQPYRDMGLDEETARTYAMIENIDLNVGRLLDKLDELGLAEDTVVVFLTDNGGHFAEDGDRHRGGIRGRKGTVYDGGIRVPCFVRWSRGLPAAVNVPEVAAHIDLFPTMLGICGLPLPDDRTIDGRNLLPLMTGDSEDWPDRNIFLQWHRGDAPEPFRGSAVRGPRYKLVDGKELYDLHDDPAEERDIAADYPHIVREMRASYEVWFADVSSTRGYDPVRIHVGTPHERPTVLSPQDWRGTDTWVSTRAAHWDLHVERAGLYNISLLTLDRRSTGRARISIAGSTHEMDFPEWDSKWTFTDIPLPEGDTRLAFEVLEYEQGDMGIEGVRFAEVARIR